ncbi:MAG: hypothetical protein ABIA37_05235 [Candidatus Woesearchaeota archaeon]
MIGLLVLSTFVFAQQGIHEPGTGIDNPEIKEAGPGMMDDDTEDDMPKPMLISAQVQEQERARNYSELKEMMQERKQEMIQEMENWSEDKQKVYQNQNIVREAVHSFLAMENLTDGIGPRVSEIARNFNNSVQATIRAEEKIQMRSAIARFFAGGDKDAADELEKEIGENQLRVQELKQLKEQCNCSSEVKAMFGEQVQNMEQEQNRLQELAQKEKKSKGLFGWLWK